MKRAKPSNEERPVSLKMLAEHLNLSPATISLVVNDAPGAKSIGAKTRERVLAAAAKFNYRPNFLARSLRTHQSFTIGVIVPEFSEGYFTMVMNGVEEHLLQSGYLHLVVSHQGRSDLIESYPRLLMERSVDGLLLVNTLLHNPVDVPVVAISGHKKMRGVANVMLDHDHAALLAMQHLYDLGHRDIVFMKGQPHALDSESRWASMRTLAESIGLRMRPELCVHIHTNSWSPELGYPVVRDLLATRRDFTAIVCFNDIAAIGAMRAIADAGLSCPEDISVIGFDDIASAAYYTPSLTTIRQPLRRMGEMAAQLLLKRIQNPKEAYPDTIMFEPELIVRQSTAPSESRFMTAQSGVEHASEEKVLHGKTAKKKQASRTHIDKKHRISKSSIQKSKSL
jgi:DNA-binding LacI/PurR family transcriptional regulator